LKLLQECADELASKAPKGNKFQLAAQYFSSQVTGEGKLLKPMNAVWKLANLCSSGKDYSEFLTSLLYSEITNVGAASPAAKL